MEKKKETNAQLQKRIAKAIVHVDRTKDTKEVFFSDRGLRLTVCENECVIATGYHKHVFQKWNSMGASRPYIYTERIVDLANEIDCIDGEKGYSFNKLIEKLKNEKGKELDYLIVYYYSMWLMNIFDPLYTIGESEKSSFIVYLQYVCTIARQSILLAERKEDMTNKQFINEFVDNVLSFTKDIKDIVVFEKMSDDEFTKKEMEATQDLENSQILEEQNESKN